MCLKKGQYLGSIKRNLQKLKSKHNGFYAPRFFKVNETFNYVLKKYYEDILLKLIFRIKKVLFVIKELENIKKYKQKTNIIINAIF
jgi:hypothetical protein